MTKKASPYIAADDPDLAGLDAQLCCEPVFDTIDILARLMDRQLRANPDHIGWRTVQSGCDAGWELNIGVDFDGSGFISDRKIPDLGIVVFSCSAQRKLLINAPFGPKRFPADGCSSYSTPIWEAASWATSSVSASTMAIGWPA